MVLMTSAIGFVLGNPAIDYLRFGVALIGIALAGAGASVLNQYIERDVDAKMDRTKGRPLPEKRIDPMNALLFGVILILLAILILAWRINLLTSFLVLLSAFLYVLVYTPMKRLSWLNTTIGAIPGALPIMAGWTASTGVIDPVAWILFGILFVWQHPHFFAIAWLYREDYARGGFKMLPVEKKDERLTFVLIIATSLLLWFVSLMPLRLGFGPLYIIGASFLGASFAAVGFIFSLTRTMKSARALFRASLLYLPALLILLAIDVMF